MKIKGSETKGVTEILSYATSFGNACVAYVEGLPVCDSVAICCMMQLLLTMSSKYRSIVLTISFRLWT
jgi:hypothetical protein